VKASFPKLTKTAQISELGVDAVSSIVNDKLKWLFRRGHGEHDFGIDGYIDIVLDDGSVTGQSIAVQIKCGQSFLLSKTNVGYVFYGDSKHLNYYLNSQLPILIILCDPSTRICYWELFDAQKTNRTDGGWKMIMPFSQVLSDRSKAGLLNIVGPARDHTSQLEQHWAFSELLREAERIHYAVDRRDVEASNIQAVREFFKRLQINLDICEKVQGKIELSISGYDFDKRELWEVPEVRKWFLLVEPAVRYWFYFLSAQPPGHGIKLLFACLCDAKRLRTVNSKGHPGVSLDIAKMGELLMKNFCCLNEMTNRLGMSIEKNKKISFEIMDLLDIEHGD